MAYTELVKNFNRIRDYMREFYVYGFKSRDEFTRKSARSYDDERRRLESWLGDYMQFRHTPEGKQVFLSVDSRTSSHNPLYKAWKTKSFTDGDITLHFILLDVMSTSERAMSIKEITKKVDEYLSVFTQPRLFDESTVRKKLKEYASEGIFITEKRGKTLYYKKSEDEDFYSTDILDFFSEVSPCGVIGSFLLDQMDRHKDYFVFKHHYITGAIDSEIVCRLFQAMHEKRNIMMKSTNRHKNHISENQAIPLQILISVQSGRQHLMAYMPKFKRISAFRIDNIVSVEFGEVCSHFNILRERLKDMRPHMWGVSTQSRLSQRIEYVEFTVRYEDNEQHIHHRLEREKRCGTVKKIDDNTSLFTAEIYDSSELIPWIRTFICRITDIRFSNSTLEAQFKYDIKKMYTLYGLEGGEAS